MSARHCWVAERSGAFAGYGISRASFFGRDFVELLYVARDARQGWNRRRIAGRARHACRADRIFTSTSESNAPMRALLGKRNYLPSGTVLNLDPETRNSSSSNSSNRLAARVPNPDKADDDQTGAQIGPFHLADHEARSGATAHNPSPGRSKADRPELQSRRQSQAPFSSDSPGYCCSISAADAAPALAHQHPARVFGGAGR